MKVAGVLRQGLVAIVGAALCALALGGCKQADPPGVYVLRYATPYPPNHPFSRADQAWMAYVAKASGGRLRVRPFWGGSLISADNSVLELRHGVADVALVTPIYARAGMRAVKAQTGFYAGARTIPEQVRVYRCLEKAFPVLDQELAGVRVLAVQGGNLPNILTRNRPIRALADLRGLRLRAPDEMVPVLSSLGVDVMTMPMGETYSALSKGVIDGVVAPADTLKALHFSEVGKYMSLFVADRGAYPARAISEDAWRRLPPDLQSVLTSSTPVWEAAIAKEVVHGQTAGVAFGKAQGVVFTPFPPAEQARYDDLSRQIAARNAAALKAADGTAIFQRAQAIIAADATGVAAPC